ncbi:hypothetical protein G7046_g5366 [Stylonectria norvegica]|nr:hypothetical protein G7046_g5366 [Stylonectria norvegica]
MKLLHLLQVSFGVAFAAGKGQLQTRPDPAVVSKSSGRPQGTRKFIIEVEQGTSIASMARQITLKSSRNDTYYKGFDCSDVFAGLAIETDEENVDSLRQMEGVLNVWPMRSIRKSWVEKSRHFSPSVKLNYTMHQWTGVDKLHAAGIRGKGATVAIVDTGIDYTHKALGGCFGPKCKVAGGYDLAGEDWDMLDEKKFPKKPDSNPMDHEGHGTHVAGIIAADNEWQGIQIFCGSSTQTNLYSRLTGVAPDARLLIYKVFSDTPWNTDEETLIQAFCDAYSAGADVITASLGQVDGFSDNPWALVASRLVDKGVVVTASAGNEGESGPFYSSSGSCGHGVLAVSAVNVTGKPHINQALEKWDPMPAYFTSWGPTNELLIKPDIGGPGWHVLSTVLNQSYEELSGTSMAAPYIAGVAALFIGEHGGRAFNGPGIAKILRDRIASSGKSLPWVSNRLLHNFTAPPFQVGTGLVDAWKVLKYDTELEFEPFALMDNQMFKPRWKVNITNTGTKRRKYRFKLEPAAGVDILEDYFGIAPLYVLQPRKIVPHVEFPDPVSIGAGKTKEVEFVFSLPKVDEDYLPMYSGKVWVISSHGERLSVPYGGVAYDTEKAFDTMFVSEPSIADKGGDWTWTFNTHTDPPSFMDLTATLTYPCVHLRWDIFESFWFESQWQYPPEVGKLGYVGSATTMRDSDKYWFFDPKINDPTDTISFPLMRVPRGYQSYWWFGKLANGTQIAPGNYTMRFAALRPYGNPNISDHWDIMYRPVDNIKILPFNATTNSTKPSVARPQLRAFDG